MFMDASQALHQADKGVPLAAANGDVAGRLQGRAHADAFPPTLFIASPAFAA
jgi:hypothetical protein